MNYKLNNTSTIDHIIRNNELFRRGIYLCFKNLCIDYGDQEQAFKHLQKQFARTLESPVVFPPECGGHFTPEEYKIIVYLSKCFKSIRQKTMGDSQLRIEHTILCYIIKLLFDVDKFKDTPIIRLCSDGDCRFRKRH